MAELENLEKVDIWIIIHNFYLTKHCQGTFTALRQKLLNNFQWKGQLASLRKIVKDLIRFQKTKKNKKLFIKKTEI